MYTRYLAFVPVAVVVAVCAHPAFALNQTEQQIASEQECASALTNTENAQKAYSYIGDKSMQVFEQLMAQAKVMCDGKKFAEAAVLLNQARGMVAGE